MTPSPVPSVEFRPPVFAAATPIEKKPPGLNDPTIGNAIGSNVMANVMTQAYEGVVSIAKYEQHEKEYWKDQALVDTLTGVGSRRAFELFVAEHGEPAAVLAIDGDNIGETNKKIGQEAGDFTILTLANVIKSVVRSTDKIFRVGGDEFIVILGEPTNSEASSGDQTGMQQSMMRHPGQVHRNLEQVATEDMPNLIRDVADIMLQRILDNSLFAGLKEMEIGISVGSAVLEEGMTSKQLFDAADIDMRVRKLAKLPNVTPKMLAIHQKYLEDMAEEGVSPHILTKMAKAGLFDLVA